MILDSKIISMKEMLGEFGADPCYVIDATNPPFPLTDEQHEMAFGPGMENAAAFTAENCDQTFKSQLYYDWCGAGFAMVFVQSPLEMSLDRVKGVGLHEYGHHIGGMNHGRDWLRATIHLWYRACEAGHAVGLESVYCVEQEYGYDRQDLGPLLAECAERIDEPLASILAVRPTSAGRQRRSSGRNDSGQRSRGRSIIQYIHGQPIAFHADGSVSTGESLYGEPGQRFDSYSEFTKTFAKAL
jgi:hypothetical protein